jgi:hypothetical protein
MAIVAPPVLSGSRSQQIAELAAWIDVRTGSAPIFGQDPTGAPVTTTYGQQFTEYANAHSNTSVIDDYLGWLLTNTGVQLSKTIAEAEGKGLGQAAGETLTGLSAGLNRVSADTTPPSVAGILAGLTSRSLWVRIAEVILGGGLVLIALNHVLGNPAGKAAKVAGKAAAA